MSNAADARSPRLLLVDDEPYALRALAAELVELDAGYGGKPVNIGALVATIRVELARPRRP